MLIATKLCQPPAKNMGLNSVPFRNVRNIFLARIENREIENGVSDRPVLFIVTERIVRRCGWEEGDLFQ